MTTLLTPRYTRALEYVRVLFATDVRKDTEIPYIAHLLSVSALVLEHGGNEDQAIAALLHDAGEDKGGGARIVAIREEFGDIVAEIVVACSDSLKKEGAAKESWWVRKVKYLKKMEDEDPAAALVSAADKLHNARAVYADYLAIGDKLWGKFNADAECTGTLWYYRRLAEILPTRVGSKPGSLGDLLKRTVDALCVEVGESDYAAACAREAEIRQSLA